MSWGEYGWRLLDWLEVECWYDGVRTSCWRVGSGGGGAGDCGVSGGPTGLRNPRCRLPSGVDVGLGLDKEPPLCCLELAAAPCRYLCKFKVISE